MRVGMMTSFSKPKELVKITSLISKNYGIEIVYFRPKDVNMEKATVNGQIYINNEWIETETEIPPFIDISPQLFRKKNRQVTEYLKRKTFLSDDRKNELKKRALQEKLSDDSKYSHLVLPTFRVTSYEDLKKRLDNFNKVVLKPSGGIQGKRIYVLEKKEQEYLIGYRREEKYIGEEELRNFFDDILMNSGYLVQKYVSSRTAQGDPFDCRIHVEKNGNGEWESARNYIRIGIGQKIISNVNQGGGIADIKQFLKANFNDKWEKINKEIDRLAVTLPYKVEELRGTHLMSLGIDVGIGKNGELYVFEVNDGPATAAVISEVAYLRSNYFKYVLTHELGYDLDRNQTGQKKDKEILDNKDYRKEYNKIKQSTSWRVTAPLRKLGSLSKKLKKK